MTDYITKTGTDLYNKAKFKPSDRQKLRVVECEHNATATAIPASNVVNMVTIPANCILLGATVDVSDNQANTDLIVGVTADADYFAVQLPLDANATTVTPTTIGTGGGLPYHTNAATQVIVTANANAINAAVFKVRAVYVELDAQTAVN